MRVSVIVPTLNEATVVATTLAHARQPGVHEVIVVDGGSTDATRALAGALADVVMSAPRGRAAQMNAGAARATGDLLLFLHADTTVPPGFAQAAIAACERTNVVGGHFEVRLDPPAPLLRLTAALMNWRSRLTGIATGDQTIFIRRDAFEQLGGYAAVPLMEDIDLSRRMKRLGRLACLHERVTTSARRWQRDGIVRTILLMWSLRLRYALGAAPERLHARYRDTR